MKKVGEYALLLVIGAIIGLSAGIYVSMYQTSGIGEQTKVTLRGIEYTVSEHSSLKFELENNVPERYLEGTITVYQDEKQWTGEVSWYYSGYGTAEVICDSINENQNFRITYIETDPKAIYLDRIIEWNEVSTTSPSTFTESEKLSFT